MVLPTPTRRRTAGTLAIALGALLAASAPAHAHALTLVPPPARVAAATPAAAAQPDDRAAVRRAVLDYVEGFYEGDSTRLLRSMWPEVRKYGYARSPDDGSFRGMAMEFPSGFMRFANGVREGRTKIPPNAPKEIVIFDVADQTASAKLTAYWGIDYLLLAKENGRWMITHVLWQSPPKKTSRGE